MSKDKYLFYSCGFAFASNLILFGVKLYIGLKSNSISIFSDAINNLFDSLSGVITLISLYLLLSNDDNFSKGYFEKGEQLFSFLMSLIIVLAGFYFAYNSIERFMYPTPVWFITIYAVVLAGTALAKIIMYFIYNSFSKKSNSPVIKVMKTDCILDFCITLITIVTLIVSQYGSYSFDALFGLIISLIIIISAFKMLFSSGKSLINYVSYEDRVKLKEIIEKYKSDIEISEINFYTVDNFKFAYIKTEITDKSILDNFMIEVYDKTGINIKFIL